MIILIASISMVVTYFIAKAIIGTPSNKQVSAEVVELIKPDLTQPSSKIFNRDAINPTVVIQIGNPSNQQPFGQ